MLPNDDYFAGLFDGEGWFSIKTGKNLLLFCREMEGKIIAKENQRSLVEDFQQKCVDWKFRPLTDDQYNYKYTKFAELALLNKKGIGK